MTSEIPDDAESITSIASRIGVGEETLRGWCRKKPGVKNSALNQYVRRTQCGTVSVVVSLAEAIAFRDRSRATPKRRGEGPLQVVLQEEDAEKLRAISKYRAARIGASKMAAVEIVKILVAEEYRRCGLAPKEPKP